MSQIPHITPKAPADWIAALQAAFKYAMSQQSTIDAFNKASQDPTCVSPADTKTTILSLLANESTLSRRSAAADHMDDEDPADRRDPVRYSLGS